MKLWIDDVREAPPGYSWAKSVNEAKKKIEMFEIHAEFVSKKSGGDNNITIEVIDIDHDAGNLAKDGGDYIRLLDWLEETNRNYPIHIHSMNPVGIENIRRMIERNGWREI